jgi:hypothetical protein
MKKQHKLQPHQIELADKLYNLNQNNLFYLVTQPNDQQLNHSVNELKKHVKNAIERYTRDYLLHNYRNGLEDRLFKYVLFIEYPKEFYLAISLVNEDLFSMYSGVHFHLFISSDDNLVCFHKLFYYILSELSYQKVKEKSIKKFDYKKIEPTLDRRFAEYHTKQHYHFVDENRLLINL